MCKIEEAPAALSKALGNAPLTSDLIDLCGLDFREWNFSGAKLVRVTLPYCDLRKTHLEGANLSGCDLHGATLK